MERKNNIVDDEDFDNFLVEPIKPGDKIYAMRLAINLREKLGRNLTEEEYSKFEIGYYDENKKEIYYDENQKKKYILKENKIILNPKYK